MGILKNKQVVLTRYTSSFIKEEDFKVVETEIEDQVTKGSSDVLLQNLWASVDPGNRLCIHGSPQGLYIPQFQLNKPLSTVIVSKVIATDNDAFEIGDYVTGFGTVSDYTLLVGGKGIYSTDFRKVEPDAATLHHHLGTLGYPGFTAWVGLVRLARIKQGEEIFVSSAMSGVGIVAGQIAKLRGCRVVGSAGSDEKVRLLKEKFGYDDAFNYKTEKNWDAALERLFPKGIDVYLENVGGGMLEAVLNHMNHHARIAVSGMISQYNTRFEERYGVRNLMNLVGKCAKMEGFLCFDHLDYYADFLAEISPALKKGKLVTTETVTDGIDSFPSAFVGIMKGHNTGKHLIRVNPIA